MDASALDDYLRRHEYQCCGDRSCDCGAMDARAELAALRARVEDLEMIARAFADQRMWRDESRVWFTWAKSCGSTIYMGNADDGLPLLTPEARRALRGENEGKVST